MTEYEDLGTCKYDIYKHKGEPYAFIHIVQETAIGVYPKRADASRGLDPRLEEVQVPVHLKIEVECYKIKGKKENRVQTIYGDGKIILQRPI
jgi:hypothetical protein